MKLSKYEQETIINFNEEETVASIYTHNAKLKERLKMMAEKYPSECIFSTENAWGGVTYKVSKKLITVRMPYSEERRKKDRERALAANLRPPSKEQMLRRDN